MEIKCDKCGETKKFAFHRITQTNKECIAIDIVGDDIKLGIDGADVSIISLNDIEGDFDESLHCRICLCESSTIIELDEKTMNHLRSSVNGRLLHKAIRNGKK